MRDTDYTSLRREFLSVGITGAMVGLAGCSDSVTIEAGSDDEDTDENDESTETPDIDTAGFSFSYDEAAKQARIEFTGGAAIDAGNVQIRQDAGREVLWAKLGSTTAGPQEDIEAGAVAVLGPEILNWEAPIESGKTIRLIYTGKETPATLERYTPPGETDTGTTVPASISEFSIDASSDQQLRISFIADKQLETLRISISGAESHSLTMADFTEQQTGSGSYQYEATVAIGTDGTYTASLDEATDVNGKDSTRGQRITDTTDLTTSTEDTSPPRIDAFSIASPSSQEIRVSFDSSERLSTIRVTITGPEGLTLTRDDFVQTEVSPEQYTYQATYDIGSTGSYTATLDQAADSNGNDGSGSQSVTVRIKSTEKDSEKSTIFEDKFNDQTYTDRWNTLPLDDEVVEERSEGYLYHESPKNYNEGGGVVSTKSFEASGIKTLRVEIKSQQSNYWGYGFNIRFDDADNSEVGIKENKWSDHNRLMFRNLNGEQLKLATGTNSTEKMIYVMTIDFDAGEVRRIKRGNNTFTPDLTFTPPSDNFSISLAEGRGHKVEFHSVELLSDQSQTETNTSLTTVFEDGFEDGEYANDWSIVWQNFGDREPTNEWSITQNNALSGDYSLYLDSNGDPNIVATSDRIIELDKDFELTVEYYVPDSENRGPSIRLLDTDQNGSKGNYIEAEEANFGRVANNNPPFGQNDIFQLFDSEASVASSSINESHQIQVTRNDDTITGYHDGNKIISIQVDEIDWDLTKDYRLALRNSGRWGGSSEIYFDNVKYSADI